MSGGTQIDVGSSVGMISSAREIPQAMIMRGSEFVLTPLVRKGLDHTTMIKITGM